MADNVFRRLLSALAGSTPAYSGPANQEYGSTPRRLLSALAGSAPAVTPGAARRTRLGRAKNAAGDVIL
ncbi:hypothetical protein, partial [Nocardia brasiliensis]|uniref:hypothetical protein n=1 Tax=Nocardia brasiliensis TaxID=37326 RepID=UPI0024538EF6